MYLYFYQFSGANRNGQVKNSPYVEKCICIFIIFGRKQKRSSKKQSLRKKGVSVFLSVFGRKQTRSRKKQSLSRTFIFTLTHDLSAPPKRSFIPLRSKKLRWLAIIAVHSVSSSSRFCRDNCCVCLLQLVSWAFLSPHFSE